MANIYTDQHCELNDLLKRASSDQGATLLIPDLQRPFVWSPRQAVWLIDSLIRGWPFGTFLTWRVAPDDPVRALARPFWKVVDRTDGDNAEQLSKKNPPGSFQMVLDGQQRIQSLLLAAGGDAWGFKLFDRDWQIALTDERPRGRQGIGHWAIGCLCIDLTAFQNEYAITKRVMALDFTKILKWVVTGGVTAQSSYDRKGSTPALPRSDDPACRGRYIRLSRVWEDAPAMDGVEQEQAEAIAKQLLSQHDVTETTAGALLRPFGSLLLTLSRVKRTRVTYLELAEFDPVAFSRETYNDAVVNIFTRLNTAGRTLTREDITFAWLKVGWDASKTENKNAAACFDALGDELEPHKLDLLPEDLVAGVSMVWSAVHNKGRLLGNNDLINGAAIRPMAGDLCQQWETLTSAVVSTSSSIAERGLVYRQHYHSLNSLFLLWGWSYIAEQWARSHSLNVVERDAFVKRVSAALHEFADRWLLCSQWAQRWAVASAERISEYTKRLSACGEQVRAVTNPEVATNLLRTFLDTEVRALENDAATEIEKLKVNRRELVRGYFAALWIWHRLDETRWKMSQIQLRTGKGKKTNLDVDHTVAFALWRRKLEAGLPAGMTDKVLAESVVNKLGNCALLEKNFNISKSDKTMKSFIEQVHELKEKKVALTDWTTALGIPATMLDPSAVDVTDIAEAIDTRDTLIRKDLVDFVNGKLSRVDMKGV
jgi:hypothetical protein